MKENWKKRTQVLSFFLSLSFFSSYTILSLPPSRVVEPEDVVGHGPGAADGGEHEGLAELEGVGLSLGLFFFLKFRVFSSSSERKRQRDEEKEKEKENTKLFQLSLSLSPAAVP
jgi:hypothetical protein